MSRIGADLWILLVLIATVAATVWAIGIALGWAERWRK